MVSSESKSEFSFLAIFFGISIPNVSKDMLQRAKIEKTAGSLFGYIQLNLYSGIYIIIYYILYEI